eukprot:6847295-Alexandrium_andersonii.AAC.1
MTSVMKPRLGEGVAEPQPREGNGGVAVLDPDKACLQRHVQAASRPQPWRASEPSSAKRQTCLLYTSDAADDM